jgi:hypothetical protein
MYVREKKLNSDGQQFRQHHQIEQKHLTSNH